MFDIGFTEILLIGIVSLIVIGPERLPAVARTVGLWVGKLQRFVKGVKTDLASELETGDLKKLIGDQREQINELRSMVDSARKDFQSTTQEAVKSAKSGLADLERTVNDAKSEVDGSSGDSGSDSGKDSGKDSGSTSNRDSGSASGSESSAGDTIADSASGTSAGKTVTGTPGLNGNADRQIENQDALADDAMTPPPDAHDRTGTTGSNS